MADPVEAAKRSWREADERVSKARSKNRWHPNVENAAALLAAEDEWEVKLAKWKEAAILHGTELERLEVSDIERYRLRRRGR